MRTIKRSFHIHAARAKVWQALVDPKLLRAWGAGPAKMSARTGAAFSLWGGDIYGKNLEVVKQKKLVQEWFVKGWKAPSTLTISLTLAKMGTLVRLVQENVPDDEYKQYRDGWENSYFGPLRRFLEEEHDHPDFDHHQGG